MAITQDPSVDVQSLTPFKKFIMTIGAIPTSYLESMTYAELTMWFCNYLQNTVIPTVNNNAQAVQELQGLYVELKNYVDNYFTNLDVQEEINNKLDSMAQDGSLTLLIKNYVDPYIDEQNEEISTFKSIVNNAISVQNNKINGLENNTPIPVTDVSDMLDTTKIYLLTTDGKWYYYNGSAWTIGGDYENIDGEYLVKSYDELRKINETPLITTWYNKVIDSSGNLGANSTIRLASDLIEIPVDSYLHIDLLVSGARFNVYYYDENKTYLNAQQFTEDYDILYKNKYVRLQFAYLDNSTVSADSIDTYLNIVIANKKTTVSCEQKNLLDLSKSVGGFISANNGTITPSDSYETSDYIPVNKGDKITIFPSVRKFLAYSYIGNQISASYVTDESVGPYTYTATNNCYIRFSYRVTNKYTTLVKYGEDAEEEYFRNGYVKENIIDPSNVLSGKTLVACGDSFTQYTAAVGGDSTHTSANWSDEYNCYKTYPYWIAKRNNMNLLNEAVSGSTMTYLGTREDAFSKNRYKNLPNADFIILKFGINDDATHQNAPIGTINDNTNETYYGAWNVVLGYMLEHYPNAKIGIIISNGTTADIDNATINIAKKWGVGYLNEGLGEDLPAWFRTARSDVSQTVKDTLFARYSINAPSDTHPDVEWHKRESSIVEEWLKTLL